MSETTSHRAPVVIVGGGFGGLYTALALSSNLNYPPILLIEPKERFIFFPLLYELLSGELKIWEVAPRYTKLLAGKKIAWLQDTVTSIDRMKKLVITASGQRQYFEQLVIATGTHLNSFGIPGVREYAMGFHSLSDVERLQKLLRLMKKCEDIEQRLVVVGAGPAGVELACKIADLLIGTAIVELIEQSDQPLPSARSFNREQAKLALLKKGVHLRLNTKVLEVNKNNIVLLAKGSERSEEILKVNGTIWTAGTTPNYPTILPPPDINVRGQLSCGPDLQLNGYQDIFAIGDVALILSSEEFSLPATAQVAFQQAELLSTNILHIRNGDQLQAFNWEDLGEMISLGIGDATITGMGLTLAGPSAFHARRLAYLTRLPSLSHQLRVATGWLLSNSF
uniref:Putative NADH dehydrogenase, transport associated n=1 Tax=Paulinella chromatophora TaxID=39717 RepID=B1X563_PAUCH|nr:putative NADH dehydrogenase, transport associated [Paulinella chromatophora]ACB43082.1 putative NADH dehydrogenase, transport associated [Paulinella chromatophora]